MVLSLDVLLANGLDPDDIAALQSLMQPEEVTQPTLPNRELLDRLPQDFDTNDWRTKLRTQIASDLRKVADATGYPAFVLDSWGRDHFDQMLTDLTPIIATEEQFTDFAMKDLPGAGAALSMGDIGSGGLQEGALKHGFDFVQGRANPHSTDGLTAIYMQSRAWIEARLPGFEAALAGRSGGGGRGGGSRGPTAQEIRNQFDLDELTDAVTSMGQTYLVEDVKNARQIAKSYIDEIVRVKAKKEIDFQTFVKKRLKKTGRWNTIYRNKPHGMSEEEYLQPLVQTANAALGGAAGNETLLGDRVAGAAALGASGASFAARLQNTDPVRNQAGFIGGLEDRLRSLSGILRG